MHGQMTSCMQHANGCTMGMLIMLYGSRSRSLYGLECSGTAKAGCWQSCCAASPFRACMMSPLASCHVWRWGFRQACISFAPRCPCKQHSWMTYRQWHGCCSRASICHCEHACAPRFLAMLMPSACEISNACKHLAAPHIGKFGSH